MIFEPLGRGDEARNIDETTSVRLGLSIARSLVLRHGGRLSLSNRKPNGPIVRVEFAGPARQSRQAAKVRRRYAAIASASSD
jgi:K+-sensing histidine kinase KdpD